MQDNRLYLEIALSKIAPHPLNPRKNFTGRKFDDLAASIRAKGVYSPILVRPLADEKKKTEYQIIFGERRWRAACVVAQMNGGVDKNTIPAIVKDMTDDDAFEAMTIENLQREDLTEFEEAQSYKAYVDQKGKDAVTDLAERIGKDPRYIRRRIAVLELPKPVLKAWDEGTILYGHCEQLARLKDPVTINECFKKLIKPERVWNDGEYIDGDIITVRALQHKINNMAIALKYAKFELDGCGVCCNNSEVQKSLIDDVTGLSDTICMDPKCFKKKQNDQLMKNWKKHRGNAGTNGFRFRDGLNWNDHHDFSQYKYGDKPGEKCKECCHFVSIIDISGKMDEKQSCVGDKKCYDQVVRSGRNTAKKEKGSTASANGKQDLDTPRVAWHGEHFREVFNKERIPEVLKDIVPDDLRILHITLAGVLHSNCEAKEQFAKDYKVGKQHYTISNESLWKTISAMKIEDVREALKKVSIGIILQGGYHGNFGANARHEIASYLGIDLKREWRLNQEYLDKKTIKEILQIGDKHGILKDEKAQTFLQETLGKKPDKFTSCKKTELIRVILESGVDLAGRVPDEILAINHREMNDEDDTLDDDGDDM